MAKIEIKTHGSQGSILVDGKEVPGVRGYSISHSANGLPSVKLDLVCTNLVFDGNGVIPELPDVFKEFYEIKGQFSGAVVKP